MEHYSKKEEQKIFLAKISINNMLYSDEFNNDYNLDSESGIKSNAYLSSFGNIPKGGNYDIFNNGMSHIIKKQISDLGPTSNSTKKIFCIKKKKKPIEIQDNYKCLNLNLIRRVKRIVFDSIMKFDNIIISKLYKNLGNGISIKKLFKNNHSQTKQIGTLYNKDLLNKTQGEIFSEKITKKFTSFPLDHNKQLIESLLNEKDEVKRKIFRNLFNKTLLECINHLIGKKKYKELEGLEDIYKSKMIELDKDEEYKDELKYILNNIEKIFNSKKPRIKKHK